MTVETCKKRYEIAKEQGNVEETEFWKERTIRKATKQGIDLKDFFGKAPKPEPKEVKKHVKNSKR